MRPFNLTLCTLAFASVAAAALAQAPVYAPAPAAPGAGGRNPPAAQGAPAPSARVTSPIDLTGQWVSVVTEDWRWRMITPPKFDYESVPINPAGKAEADKWDLAADNAAGPAGQCKAWGAGGLMRLPLRVRISWADDNTLKLETDSGQQTRLFHFVTPNQGGIIPALAGPSTAAPSLQGDSKAQWFKQAQSRGLGFGNVPANGGGALRVVTRNTTGGYLRKNGVPYSPAAVITDQFNLHKEPNGDVWITLTTIVDDPRFLLLPFVVSTEFKKETNTSKWAPEACNTPAPLQAPLAPPARPVLIGAKPAAGAAKPAAPTR